MAGYLPMQELVDLIRSGFRAGADILIVIEQGELYDRSDGGFVKCFETPGQMAEADDRVSRTILSVCAVKPKQRRSAVEGSCHESATVMEMSRSSHGSFLRIAASISRAVN